MDCNEHLLRIHPKDSPPVVERAFDGQVDLSEPITSFRYFRCSPELPEISMHHSVKNCSSKSAVL